MSGRYLKRSEILSSPLTVMDLKNYLRIDHDDEDDFIASLILTAHQMVENFTHVILSPQDFSLFYDEMPCAEIVFAKSPILAVEGVRVYSADTHFVSFDAAADFTLDLSGHWARLVLGENIRAQTNLRVLNAVEIRFKAGFADEAKIPAPMIQAIRMMVAYLYNHRGDEALEALMLSGARALLAPYKMRRL